MKYKGAYH